MTDAQLHGIAAQAINMAKRDLERGDFNFLLASYDEGDHKLFRMTKIEELIIERLGENWLNSGRTKDIGLGLLRVCVDMMPPGAVIFACGTNQFRPTAKFHELPVEEQEKLVNGCHDRHHEAVKKGLLEMHDALTVVAQTPERVCLYHQDIAHGRPVGKPDLHFVPQEEFGGRLKMFGEDKHAVTG